ncbi:TPA: 2-amino-4-hydroxy-6-hydroxymethyldihydropteridine diphosphokinase [Vibrio vulnificus]|uniref:2-amino-4-hydroxy-6- hydroxymethyldihydropteridine diphosphokinase n=1 Tax=Vibrio vulnificus TaxID=672 RepID=UPI0005F17C89|nr:2-amino-4-hydroxy-6-hydroxymethyldihydropteridine diphosphokinase [Vibrio vulnificus]MDS1840400.1 2-amino-4-hydroxy-6-hydroxymethyldihydropteridine diphosphokinase [Vibrio vulnificus]MDS1849000.1 2-amino-4-hydroxy-6-hydroxymethyldihydropteridine diphosphokinase [Vibrio vulnificus]HAS6361429.1 2-amino-4-hydroxy-6-hydroxymethyldihydropteridine diphosphokinase [Vibrio vulnificus]HDY7542018.1 2-amino-4-hydroxy-6-hydroxymethyldihydropteridine diphosphokinase [Vibrio vulnificus]HDY7683516.1 2-ami
MNTVYIGVGSNIEREKHARAAWQELTLLGEALQASPIYECAAVGFDSHAFFNFVIRLNTSMTLEELAFQLRQIEMRWGREENAAKYQDRTLDLDIVLFGDCISSQKPELPRSDIFKYPFVIQPLYDLQPDLVIPGDGRTVEEIWQTARDLDTLRAVDFSL